jgi:hypothetical protein
MWEAEINFQSFLTLVVDGNGPQSKAGYCKEKNI